MLFVLLEEKQTCGCKNDAGVVVAACVGGGLDIDRKSTSAAQGDCAFSNCCATQTCAFLNLFRKCQKQLGKKMCIGVGFDGESSRQE